MKQLFTSFTMLLALHSIGQKITFKLESINVPDSAVIYIVGSQPEIGNWNPSMVPMKKETSGIWRKTIEFNNVLEVEYKFTLGSWEREGANSNGVPLSNSNINIVGDTTVVHRIEHWTNGVIRINKGQISGTVKYHQNVEGDDVLTRDLIVWLPPNYNNDIDKEYPVIYMHDGQNIIDPATSSFGTDWSVDEICDSLIRSKQIYPIIVVGIYNTKDRNEEYHPGDKGDSYLRFVIEKVKPLIDESYRTKPAREYTLTGGSSSGGIASFMLAWEYSEIFSKALCMSPAFKIDDIDYVKNVSTYNGDKKPLKFYIDNGGVGLELKLQPGIDEMIEALENKGYVKDMDFLWVLDKDAQHNESAWAKRYPDAIKWLLKDTKTK